MLCAGGGLAWLPILEPGERMRVHETGMPGQDGWLPRPSKAERCDVLRIHAFAIFMKRR